MLNLLYMFMFQVSWDMLFDKNIAAARLQEFAALNQDGFFHAHRGNEISSTMYAMRGVCREFLWPKTATSKPGSSFCDWFPYYGDEVRMCSQWDYILL